MEMVKMEMKVYELLLEIPKGYVTTYNEIAKKLNINPRLVGKILSENRNYKYPCYKVVLSSGEIGGYNLGVEAKKKLLIKDGIEIKNNKIVNFRNKVWHYTK